MPKKAVEYIYVLCPARGYIAPAKLMGPIVHPLKITKRAAIEILASGAELYEFVPSNKQTIKLTLSNISDASRYDIFKEEAPVASPVTPIVRSGVPNVEPKVDNTEEADTLSDVTENLDSSKTEVSDSDLSTEISAVSEDASVTDDATNAVDTFEFKLNDDGTVDESNIVWADYSKNQRKALRARITEINANANA